MQSIETQTLVIGAGVIGLAVGAELSKRNRELILVEAKPQFGQETSSRNSEVVHSGIYYPKDSNKTKWCIEGRERLYAYCDQKGIPYKKFGKFVVATSENELEYLETLKAHCLELGVPFKEISASHLKQEEPLVQSLGGLFFPESGIVDSHQFMQALETEILSSSNTIAYNHKLSKLEKNRQWIATVESPDGSLEIKAEQVINAGGLAAAEISSMALQSKKYTHQFCQGRYFGLSGKYQNKFKHLVYPVPQKHGLGVHVTVDLEGNARLGPDVQWATDHEYKNIESLYDCDWEKLEAPFTEAVRRYCPSVQLGDVSPALIGIRSKLFVDGKPKPDFLVETIDGFTHCLGIESPGLTSALAIAKQI